MSERLRVGIIGPGTIGRLHAEAVHRVGARLVALAGRDESKTAALATEVGAERIFTDYRTLLEQTDVDVVHVCTPNNLHFAMARDALEAGKHVVCEKPLTLTSQESRILVDLAAETGRINAVGYNNRFYPLVQEIRHRIAVGLVGRAFAFRGRILEDSLLFETDFEWRLDPRQGGESCAMATIGCHLIDLASFVLDSPTREVCASFLTVHPVRRRTVHRGQDAFTEDIRISSEEVANVLIRFANGVHGTLDLSRAAAGRRYRIAIEVDGTKGAVAWSSESANELWLGNRDEPNQVLLRDPSLLSERGRRYTSYAGAYSEGFADTMKHMVASVYQQAIAASPTHDFATFADGHQALLVHEAVLRSVRERGWVTVDGGEDK